MAGSEYEEYLFQLNSTEINPATALSVILNFQKCFTAELDPSSAELLMVLSLDERSGLLVFMKRILLQKEYKESLKECLTLLEFSILNFRKFVQFQFIDIKNICVSIILNDVYFELKRKALDVIQAIISQNVSSDFNIPNLIKCLKDYLNTKNIPASVVGRIYTFLGYVAEKYPEFMQDGQPWLIDKILKSLHHQINVKKGPSSGEIQGCFDGLYGFLVSFPQTDDSLKENKDKIYKFLQIYCIHVSEKRNVERRSALRILERHGNQFAKELYIHVEGWHPVLNDWLDKNKDDQRAGYQVLLSFYKNVIWVLTTQSPSNGKDIFQKLLNSFSEIILNDTSTHSYRFRSAVFGVSELSKCYKLYGTDIAPVYQYIINLAQHVKADPMSIKFLSVYLEAIAKWISASSASLQEHLNCLERLSVLLIDHYPKIETPFQIYALRALEKSIYSLQQSNSLVLHNYLSHVIYQGVIRTCAHPVLMDVEFQKEHGFQSENLISYKLYVSLWKYLFNLASNSNNDDSDVPFMLKKSTSVKIFDIYIKSTLSIINKLDLDTVEKSPDFSDPEYALEAKRPRDFQIFINIVDLYNDLVSVSDSHCYNNWILKILDDMILLSYKRPLVSGFYKIIATTLETADDLQFFEEPDKTEVIFCIKKLKKFIENCLLKLEHYKGDLQMACLQVLLGSPAVIMKDFVHLTVPSFQIILKAGNSYLHLTEQSIKTLERWYNYFPSYVMNPVLEQILPYFDMFLQSHQTNQQDASEYSNRTTDALRKRGKVLKKNNLGLNESRLLSLQRKVIIFLGKLDPLVCRHMKQQAVTDSTIINSSFGYKIPYTDVKPKIELREILPRICELSLSCSDRGTRTAACELLHSLVMLMMGTLVQMSPEERSELRGIFKKVVQTSLILGCDTDTVIYQIYNPLMFQLAHYYSRSDVFVSQTHETELFIEALMDGVSSKYNSALRDFSARCLREFVDWFLKQLPNNVDEYRKLVKGIFKRIFDLSLHPDYNKRLGSCVAFNNLYSLLREDKYILNIFWFEFYYYFMTSLKMNGPFDDSNQVINAIKHVERPLIHEQTYEIFNKYDHTRRKPVEFDGILMKDLVLWTLKQCVHKTESTRRISMGLVEVLSQKVKNCTSTSVFLNVHAATEIMSMKTALIEACIVEGQFLSSVWLETFWILLDFLNWLVVIDVLLTKDVLQDAKLKSIVNFFERNISNEDINDDSHDHGFLKSRCIVSLFELIVSFTNQENVDRKEVLLWFSKELWNILLKLIFIPHSLDFERHNILIFKLRDILKSLLKNISSSTSPDLSPLYEGISSINFTGQVFDLKYIEKSIMENNVNWELEEVIDGLGLMAECGLWKCLNSNVLKMEEKDIIRVVFESLFTIQGRNIYTISMEHSLETFLSNFLELGLRENDDIGRVIDYLLNKEEILEDETRSKTSKGEHFEMRFKNVLYIELMKRGEECVQTILNTISPERINLLLSILSYVYFSDKKSEYEDQLRSFKEQVYEKWNDIIKARIGQKVLLMFIMSLVQVESPSSVLPLDIADWLFSLLSQNLSFEDLGIIFSLFPYLSKWEEGADDNKSLSMALANVRRFHYFADCSKLQTGTAAHSALLVFYDNLFNSLQTTKSLLILKFIIKIIAQHEQFIEGEKIENSLYLFVQRSSEQHLMKTLFVLFETFSSETTDTDSKLIICRKFLIPLLGLVDQQSVINFFIKYFHSIYEIILMPFTSSSVGCSKDEIVKKIGSVLLIQLMYTTFDKNNVVNVVNESMKEDPKHENKGKELLTRIINKCSDLKDNPKCDYSLVLEYFRQYRCHCYNTLSTIICSSSDQIKPYATFLFKEGKNSVWPVIVDNTRSYDLTMDFAEVPKRKKKLTMIRKKVVAEVKGSGGHVTDDVKYIATQTLFDSTLIEDVTKFDFTHTPVRSMSTFSSPDVLNFSSVEIELELDSLNEHECMATVCGVIKHMVDENITPVSDTESDAPPWLKSILTSLQLDFSENTKLFLLKLLTNIEEYVKYYAKFAVPVVIKTILKLFADKEINYFISDLVVMMIRWSCVYVPDENIQHEAAVLLKYLIDKLDSPRKDIFRHNLEIIKTVIEVWKQSLDLNYVSQMVYEFGSEPMEVDLSESGSNTTNYSKVKIELSGVLLANSIPAWSLNGETRFMEMMSNFMLFDKQNHKAAAEVCGMALRIMENEPDFEKWLEIVCRKIKSKLKEQDGETSRLYCVHKHYPAISSHFETILINCAQTGRGIFVQQSVEMLLSHVSRINRIEDDYLSFVIVQFIKDMLHSGDTKVQEIALKIVEQVLNKLEETKLVPVIEDCIKFNKHRYPSCRLLVYRICMWVYENSSNLLHLAQNHQQKSKVVLLEGLNDPDPSLQEHCFDFWMKTQIPQASYQRILFIFSELYSSEVETGFISYCIRLMLDCPSLSESYDLKMFEHPLSDCSFQSYKLLNSWRAQHSTMAPMFAETLSSQLSRPEILCSLESGAMPEGKLRATVQSLIFQPTIQSDDATDNEKTFLISASAAKSSSDDNFKVPTYRNLQRRIRRSQEQVRSYFARKEATRKAQEEEREKDRARKRESGVEIYREYRIGDFPDVQISHSQLLKPLKALVKRDNIIGRKFLGLLISGLVDCMENDRQNLNNFTDTIGKQINKILDSSNLSDPTFVELILQVALNPSLNLNIEVENIANSARSSGLSSLGALLIEKQLMEEDIIGPAKRMKGVPTPHEKKWLYLAELYQSLGEFDVVRGVFVDKLEVSSYAVEGVRCEAVMDWSASANCYENVLNNEESTQQHTQFYSQSFFSCVANLSDWNKLNQSVRVVLQDDLEKLWSETWGIDIILPWFLKSEMMVSLLDKKPSFQNILLAWYNDEKKTDILKTNYGEEVTVMFCLMDKIQKAKYHAGQLCLQFLNSWSHISPLMKDLNISKLLKLQIISELQAITSILGDQSCFSIERKLTSLSEQWKKNRPGKQNNLLYWDIKIAVRRYFIEIISNRSDIDFDFEELERSLLHTELDMLKAGVGQNNFYLARRYLKISEKKWSKFGDESDLRLHWSYCFSILKRLEAKCHTLPKDQLRKLIEAWKRFKTNVDTVFIFPSPVSESLKISSLQNLSDIALNVARLQQEGGVSLEDLSPLNQVINEGDMSVEWLQRLGLRYLQTSVTIVEQTDWDSGEYNHQKAEAYLKLAKYCKIFEDNNYNSIIVENLLRSMKLGNREARELFCWLLDMGLHRDKTLTDVFAKETESVPSWMFILWINQLLASLNTDRFALIRDIILRVARDYPNSVIYCFRLSKENYLYEDSEDGKCFQNYVKQLNDVLSNSLSEIFVDALKYVGCPEIIFKYYIEKMMKGDDFIKIKNIRKECFDLLFAENSLRGDVFAGLLKFKDQFLEAVTSEGCVIGDLLQSLRELVMKQMRRMHDLLKSYSPWLNNFQMLNFDTKLEIPGQYDGLSMPLVHRHAMVSSFKPIVLPLMSKCRPVRITIMGNNAEEYKFMIKFTEDLRQDERIMQIFNHMNHTFSCSVHSNNIKIDTYKIIPLTTSLGMVQWIDNTTSLFELIQSSIPRDKKDLIKEAREEHIKSLCNVIKSSPDMYRLIYATVRKNEAVKAFISRVNTFSPDLLRQSFWKLSDSPEKFSYLRRNFATSYGTLCVAHWLLGIGDRHLQNTLVSTLTGRALGVDFGYAFGFSAQFLTPPELIPFRLTPQILNFTKPLGSTGWIKESMIQALRSLRNECTVMLAMMQVFVLEPSLDWQEQAKKQARSQMNFEINEDIQWYPKLKINILKEKLEGAGPVVGLSKDLENGHKSQPKCLKEYLDLLYEENRSEQLNEKLNVEKQVEALIELATDHHILSKTWIGWNPWL